MLVVISMVYFKSINNVPKEVNVNRPVRSRMDGLPVPKCKMSKVPIWPCNTSR